MCLSEFAKCVLSRNDRSGTRLNAVCARMHRVRRTQNKPRAIVAQQINARRFRARSPRKSINTPPPHRIARAVSAPCVVADVFVVVVVYFFVSGGDPNARHHSTRCVSNFKHSARAESEHARAFSRCVSARCVGDTEKPEQTQQTYSHTHTHTRGSWTYRNVNIPWRPGCCCLSATQQEREREH